MKPEQLSHRIGNIEDRLVEQARAMPDYGKPHRRRGLRRVASIAAVLALMAGCLAVGTFALAKEPETIYIEKEQEIIVVGNSGISLVLPGEWKGKYGYDLLDNAVTVYEITARESLGGGDLFRIFCLEGRYPMDYTYPAPGFTIALTETNTYVFNYPSDVQYDSSDPEAVRRYMELYDGVKNVEIVMSAEMLKNTMNASNWVEGTVFAHFLKDFGAGGVERTVVCDAAQSETVKQIVGSQDYGEQRSFYTDLWIVAGRDEYYLNTETGDILVAAGGSSATLSAEDLASLLALLGG